MPVTVRLLWPGPLGQCLPIGLQENSNTFQEGWLKANQQLVKENNKLLKAQNLINDGKRFLRMQSVFADNVPFETLHVWHPGNIEVMSV